MSDGVTILFEDDEGSLVSTDQGFALPIAPE